MAPLFPSGHAPFRTRLLLVLHFLSISLPPHATYFLLHSPASKTLLLSTLQPLHTHIFWTAIGLPSACFPFVVHLKNRNGVKDTEILDSLKNKDS
ncbi:hypothetical protein H5410_009277 [Solanum commersonii]|uniref:Uncharacterized protein n=1 Tax=Solanum commersonii TaxID=4109 RepID=A0A9J6AI95_SOLCO|nr:hypothetical protein H5410_009277 [Solanum commersonii]